ncbi:MAG TPA: hypothetical protein VGR97_13235 [Candidatus Acidoferrales bacterium]|nr:hypothetical protein [Candidatus Acidoferrales bacterium]
MNRRDLLKRAGAAIIPAAILGLRLPAMDASWQPGISRITAVVYDERYRDCRAFASVLVRRGATPFPVKGDCARLWYGALRAYLAGNRGNVAGLTTDSDFVVSRACGRELGLRLVYEGAHDSRGSNEVTHRLRSTAYQREIVADLGTDRASWAEMLAQSLLRLPSHDSAAIFCAPVLLKTPRSSDHPGYLTSWLHEGSA